MVHLLIARTFPFGCGCWAPRPERMKPEILLARMSSRRVRARRKGRSDCWPYSSLLTIVQDLDRRQGAAESLDRPFTTVQRVGEIIGPFEDGEALRCLD
jgi:hypothetical protein